MKTTHVPDRVVLHIDIRVGTARLGDACDPTFQLTGETMGSVNAGTTNLNADAYYSAPTRPSVEERFARFDTDGDSVISSTEFEAMSAEHDARRMHGAPGGRGRHPGGCYAGGRPPGDYAMAVQDAQAIEGGGDTANQVAALGQQVELLTAQVQSLVAKLYAAGVDVGAAGSGTLDRSLLAATDASAAASALPSGVADGVSDAASQDNYQYSTDEAGNTYATDEVGNVYAVAVDGTGTLVHAATTV